mgnify:CR=1 FL=1
MDFIEDLEELKENLIMTGLEVVETDLYERTKLLTVTVKWGGEARQGLPRPDGLSAGNFEAECGVCNAPETMCRLHPCGHMLGSGCAAEVQKNNRCPFCRQSADYAHALFKP